MIEEKSISKGGEVILTTKVDRLIEVTGEAVKDAAELKGLTEARPASKTEPAA